MLSVEGLILGAAASQALSLATKVASGCDNSNDDDENNIGSQAVLTSFSCHNSPFLDPTSLGGCSILMRQVMF